ncbi:MAG: mepA 7 [Herbinix sp.]|jgi:putative MATE family efflux protein|nr:mepA 7 [Herbinix sp.]
MYEQKNLSKGNVARQLITFAIPFIISNIIQTLYSVADMVIVGQFNGTASMSGVNIGGQVTMIVLNVAVGLSTGGTIMIAQSVGAEKTKKLQKIIGTLLSTLIIAAVILTVLMLIFKDPILTLIHTPVESYQEASVYLMVTALGTVFIFGYNALSAIMRGMGDSRTPLYFVAIACVVNIVLDLILVGVFHQGAFGAAVATIISQAISMILCVIYLRRRRFVFDFKINSFRIAMQQLKSILKLGIPLTVQNLISNLSFLFMTALVNNMGVTASAAVGAVGKYNGFAILPAIAMNAAVSAMVAQNIGAQREDRAIKTMLTGMGLAYAISIPIFILTNLFPQEVLRMFSADPELIAVGIPYLKAFAIDYLLVPVAFCFIGFSIGTGHTTFSLFCNIMSAMVIRIPMAYLLSEVVGLGLRGVGLAVPLASATTIILCLWFFFSGRWKKRTVRIEE